MTEPAKPPAPAPAPDPKAERLARALRDNLRRRKVPEAERPAGTSAPPAPSDQG